MVIKSLLKTDYTCIPKPANGVRLQAKLESKNPTGLPVGVVRDKVTAWMKLPKPYEPRLKKFGGVL